MNGRRSFSIPVNKGVEKLYFALMLTCDDCYSITLDPTVDGLRLTSSGASKTVAMDVQLKHDFFVRFDPPCQSHKFSVVQIQRQEFVNFLREQMDVIQTMVAEKRGTSNTIDLVVNAIENQVWFCGLEADGMKKAPKIVHGCKVDDNCWKPWREMAVDLMAHVSCDPNSLSTSFGGFDSRNTEEAGFCMDDQQSIWYAIGERDERRDSNRIVVLSRTHSKVDGTMIVALTSLKHWRLVSCSASNIAPHNPIRIYYGRPTVPVRLNLTTDWRMELDIFLGTMESRLNADDVLLKSHREDKPFVPVLSPPRLDFMSGILKRFKSRAPGVVGLKRTRKADDIVEPRMEPSIESRSTMSIRTSSRRLRQIVMIKDRCFYDEIETGGSGGRRS